MGMRPYFTSSIAELEKLFESSKKDLYTLEVLNHELQFRNTDRAKKLRAKVEEALRAKSGDSKRTLLSERDTKATKNNENLIVQGADPPSATTGLEQKGTTFVDTPAPAHSKVGTPSGSPTPIGAVGTPDRRTWAKETDTARTTQVSSIPIGLKGTKVSTTIPNQVLSPGTDSVLAAWLTLEVLTPQPLPNAQELAVIGRKLLLLQENPEPWLDRRFDKHGKERAVYWMLYLGELDLAKALKSILETFPEEMADERAEIRGNTTLAVVVLDSQGCPVPDKTFLSSFAWGYGKVRAGQLRELATFVDAERVIKAEIERRLIRQNEEGEIQPVSSSDLKRVIDWLAAELNLPQDEVLQPGIAVRVPQFGWFNEAPEPELLNSFFIEDLVRIRAAFREGNAGQPLSAYMGVSAIPKWQDVVKNRGLLSEILAPGKIPLSRWPGPGRYPLVLMQQAAINHAVSDLADGGLVAVNGPPGTGKTTLLRDIVARVVLDRAIAMSQFDRPETAFKHVAPMKAGNAFTHLYQLDDRLLGHEIVVASSNNKAVENISREIPSSSAIAKDFDPPLRYFQSISDAVAAGDREIVDGATWGLAAAVLGNSTNRAAFVNSFWWNKQRGMALYLRFVAGGDIPDDKDENDEDQKSRIPEVIDIEKPPRNEIEALERWRTTRKDFLTKLKGVQDLQKKAQEAYDAVCRKAEVTRQAAEASHSLAMAKQELVAAQERESNTIRLHKEALDIESKAAEDRSFVDRMRPGFFARLFRTRSYREWYQRMLIAMDVLSKAQNDTKMKREVGEQARSALAAAKARVARGETEKAKTDKALTDTLNAIRQGQKFIGESFADETFWSQDDETIQIASPWIFENLQQARDDLFVAAFALHRAFIDAAAKYLRHNIRAALEVMKGRVLSEKQEPARQSLWASLFLVVPVISTTFASTSRLFGRLGREQLGWLLIDEAGQSVPQAAVGALWRTKRAIVIGDPLQIEPVVTIPPKLINAIFTQFNTSTDEWAGPEMSVQTLADRVSWFGTTINARDGEIWVGSPLRVHRRCEEPMFSISNYVAYNGLMVYGTKPDSSPIGEILGQSVWVNIEGSAIDKWSQDEGSIVLQILRRLFEFGIENPDIFFITPFRIVSIRLREMIRNDRWITERLPQKAWEWTNERVGTIHTFQGKEADTVVLVLGAPLDTSVGARRWAGKSPNLLNVAVTRAKRRLYVVGNYKAWRNIDYFQCLASSIPVIEGRP
jgi:hypothetical protein